VQALVYDRRGHGATGGLPGAQPVRDDALDLAALMERTSLYPAHLVTHAYAGAVALRLAVDRPELVRSVVVHEAPFFGLVPGLPGIPSLERLVVALGRSPEEGARAYLGAFGAPGERWEALAPDVRADGAANVAAAARELEDPEATAPVEEELRAVSVPVLATAGAASPPFARAVQQRLVDALPNGRFLELPDRGHLVPRTDPALWVAVLGSFLLERNVPTS
jgi:pimeloyl-ACP methyl ester carboxylesterase